MKLVTTEEMRQAEQATVEAGDTWEGLMERAGKAVAEEVAGRLEQAGKAGGTVLALVGPGNNGGDALVAGRYLHEAGFAVRAYLWKRKERDDHLVEALQKREVPLFRHEEDEDLAQLKEALGQADAVIDGLLGMGLLRLVEGPLRAIVEQVNREAAGRLVVAVDLPTGVHADTGQVLGVAVRADVTVTMSHPKRGLYQFPGAEYAGEVVIAEIGIPDEYLEGVPAELLDINKLRTCLPARPRNAHKGTFGRVLVVAGSLYYTGAPYLVAMGAYRVGAGLVTLAPPRSVYPLLAAKGVEVTFFPLPEEERGAIGEDAVRLLADELPRYQAMVLGCGLGQEECTVAFVRRLLGVREPVPTPGIGFLQREEEPPKREGYLPPLVLDADGLNALAGVPEWWRYLPDQVVLTPHPGEMARLLGASREEVLTSRIAIAQRAATTWGRVVVFKGANTVVARPDGRVVVVPIATPALATAGTGDVLAGVIAGLLAQRVPLFEAALLGVYIHGRAGELVQEEVGPAGGLAGDLLPRIPWVLRLVGQPGQATASPDRSVPGAERDNTGLL